jgi:transcriptional regulator with XRE-family HTH domain
MKVNINIKIIEEVIKNSKLSKFDFAKQCGIGINIINNIFINKEIRVIPLFKIARYLNRNIKYFIK